MLLTWRDHESAVPGKHETWEFSFKELHGRVPQWAMKQIMLAHDLWPCPKSVWGLYPVSLSSEAGKRRTLKALHGLLGNRQALFVLVWRVSIHVCGVYVGICVHDSMMLVHVCGM